MKNKKILMKAVLIGFALVAFPVFAEEVTNTKIREGVKPFPSSQKENILKGARPTRQDEGQEIRNKRMEMKVATSTESRYFQEQLSRALEIKRGEFKQQFELNKDEIKKKFEKEKIRLTEKLKTIKDERKKEVVRKISDQFQEINTKRLEQLSDNLTRMEGVLVKIKARVAYATDRGVDTSAVKAKIAAFETTITTARAAIMAQSAKIYSIEIKSDKDLKKSTTATRQALQGDIKVAFDFVTTAHKSLQEIIQELVNIRNIDHKEQSPTSSGMTATTSNQ